MNDVEQKLRAEGARTHQIAKGLQELLVTHGQKLSDGTKPSIVVFKASPDPNAPDDQQWHAGIVYRQHVATTPRHAMAALGQTLLCVIESSGATDTEDEAPVVIKQLEGGQVQLPGEVWEEEKQDG